METQEKGKGGRVRRSSSKRKRHKCTEALVPDMQGGRREGTGCWSGDEHSVNNGVVKKIVVFKL